MGLSLRKRSGNIMAGSRLIVEGQPILTAKVFEVGFSGKKGSLPNEHRESPTTTTTTTIAPTPTNTPTPSITPTNSPRPTATPAVTVSPTTTKTPTPTITQTPTLTKTATPSVTVTPTNTLTPTPTVTNRITPTPTNTLTPTGGGDPLINPIIVGGDEYLKVGNGEYLIFVDPSPSVTPTPIVTSTPTPTPTNTVTPTITPTPTNTVTPTVTPTNTPTNTSTVTPTPTPTSGATGDFTVTVSQVGPDVVWSGSGSFNTTSLISNGTDELTAGFSAPNAAWAIGDPTPPGPALDVYSGVTTFPTSFGTAGGTIGTLSGSGDTFGIIPNGTNRNLLVPTGYTSGSFISGSTTYAGATIAGMNLTPGTYTWSWGSGPTSSSIIMQVGR